ncbi:MAG: AAA family ATPase, partial [Mollicutes bacterium]|nr:AAA family ATPase [Mollicutes bacterium]
MKVILLTGIHGVGKNHLCERINEKLNIPIYSASELIKKYNSRTDLNKRALTINKNQKTLLDSLKKDIKDRLFILNSHTCLVNIKDEIVKLESNWFKRMKVIGI